MDRYAAFGHFGTFFIRGVRRRDVYARAELAIFAVVIVISVVVAFGLLSRYSRLAPAFEYVWVFR